MMSVQMVFRFCYFRITVTSWYRKQSLGWNPRGCNRVACKWKVSFFIIFTLPVSQYIMSICSCQRTQKNQVQVKTKASLTAMKAVRKECFCSSCLYLACFSEMFTLLNAISWTKWPKQLIWLEESCKSFSVFCKFQMHNKTVVRM